MKLMLWIVMAAAGMLPAGTALAQTDSPNAAPRGRGFGFGYGGPPQSLEERVGRQAACLERHGGVCPRAGCPWGWAPGAGYGAGWRRGSDGVGGGRGLGPGPGYGWRRGLRDGTGPRSLQGTCPLGNPPGSRGRR